MAADSDRVDLKTVLAKTLDRLKVANSHILASVVEMKPGEPCCDDGCDEMVSDVRTARDVAEDVLDYAERVMVQSENLRSLIDNIPMGDVVGCAAPPCPPVGRVGRLKR